MTVTAALETMLSDAQKVEQAKTLGWIQGDHLTGVKWNAEKKMHEVDTKIPPIITGGSASAGVDHQ